ncbi:MAG TPA: GMC family oxidoreductase [Thermomicrobiales bacterium]|nr:GMC family oxidoreductase [Thermomicrobiales bacterium]
MADRLEADVVIVGAGVAGSLIAWTLAQAGAKVLVLESGPWVDRAKAVETYRAAVAKTPEAPYPPLEYAPRPTVAAIDEYYQQQGPDMFQSTYERRVGGTTWHWQGTAMRHLPNDFHIKTLYGVGEDWPISYDDLEPWYVQAEQALGVAGDTDMGSPRSAPYVMPAVPPSYLDLHINAALQPLGLQVLTTPQAKNSQAFDGRPPCCGNNLCVPICPIGAKYDGAVHAKKAQDAGAQIESDSVAHKIEVDGEGRVTRVLFKRPDGSEHEAVGQTFVVAAHAIETPKLLLMSRTDALPNGVANSSDQVGRNLMDHVTQVSLCLSRDPIWPFRAPVETSGIEHLRDGDHRRDWAAFRTPIGNDGWSFGGENPVALSSTLVKDEGLRGTALRDRIQQMAERQVRLAALVEQLPNPDNRVTLSEDKQDALGNPYPQIAYQVDDYSKRGMEQARALADQVFDAIGGTDRMHAPTFFGAGHIIGTYRMGNDPATSVVNPQGRTHDHPNLYLAGDGLFPTEATANPTLTLAALALWCADTIKGELGR